MVWVGRKSVFGGHAYKDVEQEGRQDFACGLQMVLPQSRHPDLCQGKHEGEQLFHNTIMTWRGRILRLLLSR